MLRKIISLSISLIIIVTGLILTNLFLPFLSNYLGYDLPRQWLNGNYLCYHDTDFTRYFYIFLAWPSIGTVYYKMAVQLR